MKDLIEKFEQGIVIVRFDEKGDPDFIITGDAPVRVFVIDERAPNDRVYELMNRAAKEEAIEAIGDSEIGSNRDERHAAIAHKINALIDGKPRLQVFDFPKDEQ